MSSQDTIIYEKIERIFINNSSTIVMGILNITDDSFYDGGNFTNEENWLKQVKKMIAEGAEIIDIGAYSSRPGAKNIDENEELSRLIPAIASVKKNFPQIIISADTFRGNVAKKAIEAGANIINDISAGSIDSSILNVVSDSKVPYILMHMQGTPQSMQANPSYTNVVENVYAFFQKKLNELDEMGINKVIIDPGFGFGKTLEHNYSLFKQLEEFKKLKKPLLVGISNKSMISKLLHTKTEDCLNGTSVLNTLAIEKGANIIRVHNVKEAVECVKISDYLKSVN